MVVIADSPMFSTLVAPNANPKYKGTALTIVNCISIQFILFLQTYLDTVYLFLVLGIGPLFGLISIYKKRKG